MNRQQQHLLAKTAALAGELMLTSGAETYRAEDTMAHILRKGTTARVTPLALTTSILVTLESDDSEPLTIVRRVSASSTNLNRIVLVNEISRDFCDDKITLEEAYDRLNRLPEKEYPTFLYSIAAIGLSIGFVFFFGGTWLDAFAALLSSGMLSFITFIGNHLKVKSFLLNCVSCAGMAFICTLLKSRILPDFDTDIVIISCLMPLVPGVAITNAIRDTLQGDYISGSARALEAFLKAAAIALGVGMGVLLFRSLF